MIHYKAIDLSAIFSWSDFHDYFTSEFGFPGFYGRNMNAWIDVMGSLNDPKGYMADFQIDPEDTLVLEIKGISELNRQFFEAIVELSGFINYRNIESGDRPFLMLSYWEKNAN